MDHFTDAQLIYLTRVNVILTVFPRVQYHFTGTIVLIPPNVECTRNKVERNRGQVVWPKCAIKRTVTNFAVFCTWHTYQYLPWFCVNFFLFLFVAQNTFCWNVRQLMCDSENLLECMLFGFQEQCRIIFHFLLCVCNLCLLFSAVFPFFSQKTTTQQSTEVER